MVVIEFAVILASLDDVPDALGDVTLHAQRVFQGLYTTLPGQTSWGLEYKHFKLKSILIL